MAAGTTGGSQLAPAHRFRCVLFLLALLRPMPRERPLPRPLRRGARPPLPHAEPSRSPWRRCHPRSMSARHERGGPAPGPLSLLARRFLLEEPPRSDVATNVFYGGYGHLVADLGVDGSPITHRYADVGDGPTAVLAPEEEVSGLGSTVDRGPVAHLAARRVGQGDAELLEDEHRETGAVLGLEGNAGCGRREPVRGPQVLLRHGEHVVAGTTYPTSTSAATDARSGSRGARRSVGGRSCVCAVAPTASPGGFRTGSRSTRRCAGGCACFGGTLLGRPLLSGLLLSGLLLSGLFRSGLLCGGCARGSTGLGTFGGAFFCRLLLGPPLGSHPGGLALGGGLFRGGLFYRGAPGCPLGLTLGLLPRGLPLGGPLGGELGLPLGFLTGFLLSGHPGHPDGLALGGGLLCGLLRRFSCGLPLGGALLREPLCPLGGGLCGGLTLGGGLF